MSTNSLNSQGTPKRSRRSPGKPPPPPPGVNVLTRDEAAEFMGVSCKTFSTWESEGRITITRYRAVRGSGRAIFYAAADLAQLREEFRKLQEPYPDPQHPGVYRVPIRSNKERLEAIIDAEDLSKVEGKHWNVSRRNDNREIEVILSSVTERTVPLKRIIMGVEALECKEQIVDFVNGDPLDCRRKNLVIKTRSEVNLHRAKAAGRGDCAATSAYRGVAWDTTRRLWRVQIGTREIHRLAGRYRDEAQAAAAYDAAARAMYGDAALLNFPDGVVPAPTFLGPNGAPVREKNAYRVPRGIPAPPPGVPMLSRDEAAAIMEVGRDTFRKWILDGHISIPRYRVKDTTGAPILYAAADIARLREELDKVGQPYPDPHPARAGVIRVPLRTLDGYIEALIDEADLAIVQGKKWNFAMRTQNGHATGAVIQAGARDLAKQQLKRLILGLEGESKAKRVVHANGNPLDCRRANLLISGPDKVTRRCFKLLHRGGRPTTSRFKGVCWLEREGKWQAQIRIDDKPKLLGYFDDEEDAAFAYDEAARAIWGDEARVNFPRPGELPSAAAEVSPADLAPDACGPAAKLPGKPTDFSVVLNHDGSVTLSWRSTNAAASAGVTFAVSRKLPGQSAFMRIGTAGGTTSMERRPAFTDATIPTADLLGERQGAQYIVRGSRGTAESAASDVLVVQFNADGTSLVRTTFAKAA